MIWIRLAIAIIVYFASCIGLGYFAGLWVRRQKWSGWVRVVFATIIACIWPIIILGNSIYEARHYRRQYPNDVADAPGMVFVSMLYMVPLVFLLSLLLAFVGQTIRPTDAAQVIRNPVNPE
jgi:hypothetical protein